MLECGAGSKAAWVAECERSPPHPRLVKLLEDEEEKLGGEEEAMHFRRGI